MTPTTTTPTTTTPTVKLGAIVGKADDTRRSGEVATDQALLCEVPGMFVVNTGRGQEYPYFTFGLLTGRTRRMFGKVNGIDCPTFERFEVDTVVRQREDGVWAIYGVPGNRVPGVWFTRPENIVTV